MRCPSSFLATLTAILLTAAAAKADLMGYWSFDDGTGSTTLADGSGRGNNGTLAGTSALPTWVSGHTGTSGDYSLQFTPGSPASASADPYVLLGDRPDLRIAGDQTITVWVYPTDMTDRRGIYGKAYGGAGTINVFRDSERSPDGDGIANVIYFYGNTGTNSGTPNVGYQSLSAPLVKDQWNFISVTRDLETTASDGQLVWSVNGSRYTATPIFTSPDGSNPVVPGNLPVYFGRAYTSNWSGMIDNASVWDEALDRRAVIALQHDAYTPTQLAGDVYLVDVAGYTYSVAPNAHNPAPPANAYYRDENKDAGSPTGDLTDVGRFVYTNQSPSADDGTVGWNTAVDITFDLGGIHMLDKILIGYSYWESSANGVPDDLQIALSTDGVFDTEPFTTYTGFDGREFRNDLFLDVVDQLASYVMLRFDGGSILGPSNTFNQNGKYILDEVAFFATPEPSGVVLLGTAAAGTAMVLLRRRRRRV